MEAEIPPCEYRSKTDEEAVFYCRHSRVRAPAHLVTPEICCNCLLRQIKCSPRPERNLTSSPTFPAFYRQAWNAVNAVASFVSDGVRTATKEQYEERLSICESCEARVGNRCRRCGCNLSLKAKGRAFKCPLGKWPDR